MLPRNNSYNTSTRVRRSPHGILARTFAHVGRSCTSSCTSTREACPWSACKRSPLTLFDRCSEFAYLPHKRVAYCSSKSSSWLGCRLSRSLVLGAKRFASNFSCIFLFVDSANVRRSERNRLVDALALADPYFSMAGSVDEKHPDGRWKMSECVFDCKAFTSLKVRSETNAQ